MDLLFWIQLVSRIPERVLQLLIPKRCAYCGRLRDPAEERKIEFTQNGRRFHPEWVLCESCQDFFMEDELCACQRCGTFRSDGLSPLECSRCRDREFWFDRVIPYGRYAGNLREAIFMMKKKSGAELVRTFARICTEGRSFMLFSIRPHVILPVPMHPFFRWIRGVNDAQILADELGKILGVPVDEQLVKRSRLTMAQRAVRMEDREKNVEGVFVPFHAKPDRTRWLGKRAMVVDDVMTTGATLNEVAKVLKTEYGFLDVTVVVLARARGKRVLAVPQVETLVLDKKRVGNVYEEIWDLRNAKQKTKEGKQRKFNERKRTRKEKKKSSRKKKGR